MTKSRLKKVIGKKSTGIIVTILTFGIVFGAIFASSNLAVAADSLPGIIDVRNDMTSEETPYRILEIVPDRESAEIGFLVGGQEPFSVDTLYDNTTKSWIDWETYLSLHTEDMSKAQRESFMNDLYTENTTYVGTSSSDDKPVIYQTYKEVDASYDGAKILYGGSTAIHGYFVANSTADSGWNAKFTLVPPSSGYVYDELIASDNTIPYYIVESVEAMTEDALSNSPAGYYLYTQTNASINEYTYACTVQELSDLYASYAADDVDRPVLSDYYIVKYRLITGSDYGPSAPIMNPAVYTASDFAYLEANGPYIVSTTGAGEKGHTMIKPSANVYYIGGFTSNEWFKRFVFDIDEAECDNYNIEVTTATAEEVNAMTSEELDAFDFIYLNAGTGRNGVSSFNYVYGDTAKDLSTNAVKMIFEKICNNKIPCIVDYALIGNASGDNTNSSIYALACMLMQSDYRGILSSDGTFDENKIIVGPSSSVSTWRSSIMTNNSYNYVNGNVMVINTTTSGNLITQGFHSSAFNATEIEAGYSAVKEEIETENLYRAADQTAGYPPLDSNIYKSSVVRYIINYVNTRELTQKAYINVLEIQPGAVRYSNNNTTHSGTNELTPDIIRNWLGVDSSVTVNIITVTTNEFVGRIEDLNSEYDLIYIGADVYSLPNLGASQSYKTDYRDPNMDGMIYTNIGDIKSVKAQFAGQLDSDYTNTARTYVKSDLDARYCGNDITADKFNALVDYMLGTYPIVVADKLCTDSTTPSEDTLDNCSYMFSFLSEHLDKANVFTVSEINDGKNINFKFYANRSKLDIGTAVLASQESSVTNGTAFVVPGALDTSNDTTEGHVTYISKENGKFYLKYKFTITNDAAVYDSTKYSASLYLDSNADGKFSVEYEEIADITLTHAASGRTVTNGQLVAGEQYILTRQVPDSFSGVLTWKVEVKQANNQYIRDSITGYTRLYDPDRQAVTINVLHVYKDSGSVLNLEQAIGNTESYNGNNDILETLVWGGYYGGVYYEGITDDFKFNFTSIPNKAFNKSYETGYLHKVNSSGNLYNTGQKFNLMDYDMFVLGFYDSYNLANNSNSQDISEAAINGTNGIKEFIDSGKSVLFAHDTTSFVAVKDFNSVKISGTNKVLYRDSPYNCSAWAYTLNKNIREMVGLDAYGVSLDTKEGIDYSKISTGSGMTLSDTLMQNLTNTIGPDGHYTIGLKALAYTPGSGKTSTVGETQGLTYSWMETWNNSSNYYRLKEQAYTTVTKAEKVNEGQITTYPYYLPDSITTATTHSQYFTLDLNADDDGDNETDLVVWYTLSGAEVYNKSPKDVVNNYYIYNKGNITYTGIGHSANSTTIEEGKLFINTMVAAYNASVKEPQVTVYESEDNLSPTSTFYQYGDVDNGVAFRENTQRMYFSVNDTNVIRGTKTASATYYVALKSGATAPAGYTVYTDDSGARYIQVNLQTYTMSGAEVNANALQCGVVYYVDIPTSVFDISGVSGQNVNTFMVAAKTTLKKTGALTGKTTIVETSTTYNKVEYIHVELFPLD